MTSIDIPYSRQSISPDDIEAVTRALNNPLITQGPYLKEFEAAVAAYCGARYAVGFSNGTSALHASCLAAGLGPKDEGLVPPISFVATANCLRYVGAVPRFVDVTPGLPLLDPEKVAFELSERTKVIIPVHFAGATADMPRFQAVASANGATLIEDACHALGAHYQGEDGQWSPVGSCRHSDMAVFSFHPVKSITTGEGGMVTTNSAALYEKLLAARQHGIIFPDASEGRPGWYYEMQDLGHNFRMNELQAALGLSQLKKLDSFVASRGRCFEQYRQAFVGHDSVRLLVPPKSSRSAFHLCPIVLSKPLSRDRLFQHLRGLGIGCQLHYIPIYRQPYYQKQFDYPAQNFPNAEAYFEQALSLPCYPNLSATEQDRVITTVLDWIKTQ